ncbi:MAG: hypothetical protein WD021_08835 [Rhodothermales bacterium]
MNTIVPYAIWAALIIMGLGILGMALFGVKSIIHGKINPVTGGIILIPIVLLAVLGFVLGDWAVAGIWTVVAMFGLAAVGLLLSGIRGLFT